MLAMAVLAVRVAVHEVQIAPVLKPAHVVRPAGHGGSPRRLGHARPRRLMVSPVPAGTYRAAV